MTSPPTFQRLTRGLFLLLLLASSAWAKPLDGQWQSSTGSGVDIRTTKQGLTIVVTPGNGQASRWSGRWLRQWDLFDYRAGNNEVVTGQVVNADRIELKNSNGHKYVWTRLQAQPPAQPRVNYAALLQGRWLSSSGTTFDLVVQNGSIYVVAFASNGTQYQGRGVWLDATSFRYGIDGFPGQEGIASFMSDGRLKVVGTKSNKVTYWTKRG